MKTFNSPKAITSLLAITLLVSMGLAAAPIASATSTCDYRHGSELSYANGRTYCMLAAHINATPSPNLLASAQELYLAAYFPLPTGCDVTNPSTCGPETLAGGFQPNCNPCFHGGALNNFPYHDHVLAGSPGLGNHGTAGEMKGPWVVIIVVYNPEVSNSPTFKPLMSAAAIDAGEASGMFLPINPTASNPYEINSGVVLICPVVQQNK